VPTDLQFTGQRLDATGLYYYNARYYNPEIGRFISADTFVQQSTDFNTVAGVLTVNMLPAGVYPKNGGQAASNPQALNRYTYTLNNPVRYTDLNGWWTFKWNFLLPPEAALGLGGGSGVGGVWDGKNSGIIASGKVGAYTNAMISQPFISCQWTDAPSIAKLNNHIAVVTGPQISVFRIDPLSIDISISRVISKDYSGWEFEMAIGLALSPISWNTVLEGSKVGNRINWDKIFPAPSNNSSDPSTNLPSMSSTSSSNPGNTSENQGVVWDGTGSAPWDFLSFASYGYSSGFSGSPGSSSGGGSGTSGGSGGCGFFSGFAGSAGVIGGY